MSRFEPEWKPPKATSSADDLHRDVIAMLCGEHLPPKNKGAEIDYVRLKTTLDWGWYREDVSAPKERET